MQANKYIFWNPDQGLSFSMVNYTRENSLMDKECTDTGDSFTFSCCEYDNGFDMDLPLPYNGNNSPLEVKRESEEFEFSISVSAINKPNITEYVGSVSPADDLFYKGQLLPLHLRPRLEMVRNLSLPKELEGGADGPDRYSSGSSDSNQGSGCCKESRCRSAETEDKNQQLQPKVKSATKSKVKVPMFGFSKFSKVGMDDFDYSLPLPPPMAKPMRLMAKSQSAKAASLPFSTTDYSTKQNPDYPFNNNSTITSAKNIVQKYVRLVKHRISSQRHGDAHTDDQQLKVDEGFVWPSIADESGRQTHGDFMHSGAMGINSSPTFWSEDLQSAIAYCKQSSGIIGRSKDSQYPA